jgi:hypothetical protein
MTDNQQAVILVLIPIAWALAYVFFLNDRMCQWPFRSPHWWPTKVPTPEWPENRPLSEPRSGVGTTDGG